MPEIPKGDPSETDTTNIVKVTPLDTNTLPPVLTPVLDTIKPREVGKE